MWCPFSSAILSSRSSPTPQVAASRSIPAIAHQTEAVTLHFKSNFKNKTEFLDGTYLNL
jgi:hypothetical protein